MIMDWHEFKEFQFIKKTTEGADTALFFFHGYGADANDLAPLANVFQLGDKKIDWYFPQGLLEVPIGPMMSGRGWFSIENRDWSALARGEIADDAHTPAVKETLRRVVEFINHFGGQYQQILLGGFSQGAILLTHSFYKLECVPRGLVLLSGYLVSPSEIPLMSEEQKIPFFQSHGRQDPVLPIKGSKKLFEKLSELGLDGQFMEFDGQHEIPPQVISAAQAFMSQRLE